ncbi:MAG TPA: aminotransferase class V-fold PLP-dependent enzyme [Gaiellales bacterium]|nr:aminotransferase class V-fold PLP-dependent enzyme [Gaiellales bacterium]
MSRDELPALRGCAYLNAGTNGPVPRAAHEAMLEELELQAVRPRIGPDAFGRMLAVRNAARAAFAGALGVPAEQVALTSSTTQGMGLVLAGLAWRAGDEVVTTDAEHTGLLGPLDMLTRRFGVEVRIVPAGRVADAIRPTTRMVAISHVLWTDGRILPLDEIAGAAHAAGATVLVDGAQSAGNIPLDVVATGADYYAVPGQKWLLGPQGSGALWVRPELNDLLAPALAGYLSFRDAHVGELKDGAARFDAGTIDPVTLAGAAAACAWVEAQSGGRAAWLEQAAVNARRARERLAVIDGLRLLPGDSGLIAVELAGVDDPSPVVERLAARGVLVRTIPGTARIRLSVGAWTTDDDVEAFAAGLREG